MDGPNTHMNPLPTLLCHSPHSHSDLQIPPNPNPTCSSSYQKETPPLMRLPPETLDTIASHLSTHTDLLSLALTSKACHALIIPRHIQYRIIRVRGCTPLLFAHLSRRTDLSRHIRSIAIQDKGNNNAPDRFPTSLLSRALDGDKANFEVGRAMKNLCGAVGEMRGLRSFEWGCVEAGGSAMMPVQRPEVEGMLVAALARCSTLERLVLRGAWGRSAGPGYALWQIRNLTSLVLHGPAFGKPTHAPGLLHLLTNSSTTLTSLSIPLESPALAHARLPSLKHVSLSLQSGVSLHPTLNANVAVFLARNGSVESLEWIHQEERPAPPHPTSVRVGLHKRRKLSIDDFASATEESTSIPSNTTSAPIRRGPRRPIPPPLPLPPPYSRHSDPYSRHSEAGPSSSSSSVFPSLTSPPPPITPATPSFTPTPTRTTFSTRTSFARVQRPSSPRRTLSSANVTSSFSSRKPRPRRTITHFDITFLSLPLLRMYAASPALGLGGLEELVVRGIPEGEYHHHEHYEPHDPERSQ
ncbi:hypothetical protein BDV98DRAFT_281261 [Pterulicium gracile]|uniref:F-box domain-containing protein n=1 Tax=Pterulicium gracile TaxID=1884261 RepID=A0A5C3QSP0_9AGAR|nr:hypothetical protein BDV98DRAFT_281261 [Pterula gracilis]